LSIALKRGLELGKFSPDAAVIRDLSNEDRRRQQHRGGDRQKFRRAEWSSAGGTHDVSFGTRKKRWEAGVARVGARRLVSIRSPTTSI
jgi:hypothetical protein